jgi:TPR repeat protein
MAYDVFISYASEDKIVADAACAMLEAHAVRCWIAPRDVIPGMAYGEAIIDAIRGCRIMILVFSSKSNKSPHIPKEIERAVSAGVAVIPFRIEDVKPGKSLDYFIGSVHWLDALTPPLEQHLERLVHNVKTLLSRDEPVIDPKGSFAAAAPASPAASGAGSGSASYAASGAARSVAASVPTQGGHSPSLYAAVGILAIVAIVFAVLYFSHKPSATAEVVAPAPVSATPPATSQPPATVPQSSGVATETPSAGSGVGGSNATAATPKPAAAAAPRAPRKEPATAAHESATAPKKPETPSSPSTAGSAAFDQGLSSYKSKNFSQAATLYQKACDAGERRGCTNLGLMYYNADGMPKDLDRAAGLFKRACDEGGTGGCMNLGLMYVRGESVAKDPHRAAELFERACDTKVAVACTNLGLMYARGENLPQDLNRAADLYQRACDGGNAIGCNLLGLFYQHGRGVTRDVDRANELFKKACAAGNDQGCENLAHPKKQRRD